MEEVEEQEYSDTEGGSGVMVSNLPLVFSGGSPSSLYDMEQGELEVFVPFMVRCSVGEEAPVPWSQLPRPPWWPKKLPFRMPSARTALIGLVERCYSFHGCNYLLQFCASLVVQTPPQGYRFSDNRDGTTSMYHGLTGKLLVTFRNENRDYDKYRHGGRGRDATRRLLLSPSSAHSGGGGGGGGGASTAMFQPPITDIFLCDKCENEFYSLKEVQAHERHCGGEVPSSPPTPSPEPEVAEEEPELTGEVAFLSYFNLRPAQHTGLEPHMSPRKKSVSSPPAKLPGPIYPRYDIIPLTSPLGRYLFAHSKSRNKYQNSQHSVMRYERHLPATPNADINYRERCTNRWIVVWRTRKDQQQPWVHQYSFSRMQQRERIITIETGLSRDSRRLLRLCRLLKVRLKRLPKRMVNRLLRLGGPTSAPCIDLTEERQQLAADQPGPQPLQPQQYNSYWLAAPAQGGMQVHWVPGLPPEQGSASVPGSSGAVATPYTTQLGRHTLVGLTHHHSSFNDVTVMPGNSRQQFPAGLPQQLSGVSCRPPMPLVPNNSHGTLSHAVVMHDATDKTPYMPPLPDVSIKKLPAAAALPTHSQLEADLMRPLSRKKFPGHLATTITTTHLATAATAFPPPQPLPLVPPQPPDWERAAPTTGGGDSARPHRPHISSPIEVIELSSDEDEYGRGGRGHSEAANAPQQLDGLACYPHTGAKVPAESSQYSSSKNGNSHWSSQQKSRCGAGRVGDLATNGQPPNVLPSPLTPSTSPCLPHTPQARGSGRKRKAEDDSAPPRGAKTVALDVSGLGGIVAQDGCPLSPATSVSSEFSLPGRDSWTVVEEAAVPVSPLPPPHSATTDKDSSFKIPSRTEENISFGEPQPHPDDALADSPLEAGSGVKFLVSLVTKGVDFIKSLVGNKDGEAAVAVSPGGPAGPESQRGARAGCVAVSRKRSLEVQALLRDECRELRRGGLRELSHPDLQGVRLTRRSVGHMLPLQASRKSLGARPSSENRPPDRHGSRARREEKRGCREVLGRGSLGLKGPAPPAMDENGNSASYVQAGPQQSDGRECFGPAPRVQNGQRVVPGATAGWGVGGSKPASTLKQSECKLSNGSVRNSTVFSEISIRNCDIVDNTCSSVWGGSVANSLDHTKCGAGGLNSKVTPAQSDSCPSIASAAQPTEVQVCRPQGEAAPGPRVSPGNTCVRKVSVLLHRVGKDLPSPTQAPPARPELTGKTAEECGAQLALCPLPDQLHHHPGDSSTPPPTPRPRLTLLNSMRKERSPPTTPYLCGPTKPQSTNRSNGSSSVCRELISLARDEWKEIKGSGFHPSDHLASQQGNHLGASDDQEEAPSPSPCHSLTPPSPAPRFKDSSGRERKRCRVNHEVARLVGDECKELGEPKGDKEGGRSKHPLANIAILEDALLGEEREAPGSAGHRYTRSQVNTAPEVEIFTRRESHRLLLRTELAMCVVSYRLPNIH